MPLEAQITKDGLAYIKLRWMYDIDKPSSLLSSELITTLKLFMVQSGKYAGVFFPAKLFQTVIFLSKTGAYLKKMTHI